MQSQSFTITDLEAYASKFYQGRPLLLTPYGYTLTFSSLASGASASQTLNIAANADFIFVGLHARANVAAAGQTAASLTQPLARVLIVDSGSNEQYTNSAVDLFNYATTGNITNPLIYPRIVSGRSTLTVTLSNYDAAQTYNIDLFLEGVLVRAYGAAS
jgi:hypothetical protein